LYVWQRKQLPEVAQEKLERESHIVNRRGR